MYDLTSEPSCPEAIWLGELFPSSCLMQQGHEKTKGFNLKDLYDYLLHYKIIYDI